MDEDELRSDTTALLDESPWWRVLNLACVRKHALLAFAGLVLLNPKLGRFMRIVGGEIDNFRLEDGDKPGSADKRH